jgi:hypothetical protein
MKNVSKLLGGVALIMVIVFSMTACGSPVSGGGGDTTKDLPGTIAISPNTNVKTGTELTATYTASGDETITTWQWKKSSANVGTNSNKFTPTSPGSYTVTVSAEGYKAKTSAAVTVTQYYPPLAGTVSVTPTGPVETGTKLTVVYTPDAGGNSSDLTYRWEKNGSSANSSGSYTGSSIEFTPTDAGVYTITITRTSAGSSKTSDPVIVRTPGKKLTTQKWNEIYNEIRYTELEDGLLDLSEYTRSDNAAENPGLNSSGELILSYSSFINDNTKEKIKKIILPNAATSVKAGTSSSSDLRSFENLEEISGVNITTIGNDVFSTWLDNLTTVYFPNVETIGDSAFRSTSLTEVNFPKATSIGNFTFSDCTSLVTVELPEAATIGNSAFFICTSLVTIDFPEAATIGNSAFYGCTSLETVNLPKVTTIGTKIFENCSSLETVTLGKITSIGIGVFTYGTIGSNDNYTGTGLVSIKTVNLPEVTTIPDFVFYGCAKLESVTIPKVISVGKEAFYNCAKLGSIEFLNVTTVGLSAFRGCTSLVSVNFPKVTNLDWAVFYDCTNLVNVAFPELLTLNGYTFYGCTKLESVSLPKVTDLAYSTFNSCTSLSIIALGATAPIMRTENLSGITTAKTVTVKIPSGATGYSPLGTYNDKDTISINWANGLRGCGWENGNFTLTPGFNAAYYLNKNITIVIANL